jgi:hypothetical protein
MRDTVWLLLDEHGIIHNRHGGCDTVFGRRMSDIARHVSTLLPELANIPLLEKDEPNPRLRYLSRIGVHSYALSERG